MPMRARTRRPARRGEAGGRARHGRSLGALLTLLCAAGALGLGGCAGYVGDARGALRDGRYLEALETLCDHDADFDKLSPKKQALYALVRGRALTKLGEYAEAARWLRTAHELELGAPGTLSRRDRDELAIGYAELSSALGTAITPETVVLPADGEPSASDELAPTNDAAHARAPSKVTTPGAPHLGVR